MFVVSSLSVSSNIDHFDVVFEKDDKGSIVRLASPFHRFAREQSVSPEKAIDIWRSLSDEEKKVRFPVVQLNDRVALKGILSLMLTRTALLVMLVTKLAWNISRDQIRKNPCQVKAR